VVTPIESAVSVLLFSCISLGDNWTPGTRNGMSATQKHAPDSIKIGSVSEAQADVPSLQRDHMSRPGPICGGGRSGQRKERREPLLCSSVWVLVS
jgi:hypothetical protein